MQAVPAAGLPVCQGWEQERRGSGCSYFLSSRLELGFFISINAQPNFYRKEINQTISFPASAENRAVAKA